jgi:type VI secretion system protein ImpA
MAIDTLDLEQLRKPIDEPAIAGHDIRTGPRVELYYRLKDARSAARAEERSLSPGEPFRLSPAWDEVRALCIEALSTLTSDIEILAWLAEAELRLNGFAGLAQVFDLTAFLVRDRFELLHSIDAEDMSDKVAPLTGLNGVGGEGTLIQPIRLAPLIPGRNFFTSSLWDFQLSQRPGEESRRKALKDASVEAGPAAMRAHHDCVSDCLRAFSELTAELDARCGADAPASSAIRAVLEEARLAVVNLGGLERVVEVAPAAQDPTNDKVSDIAAEPAIATPGPIRSRDEAFDRLLEVADYFRRSEPQSPVSMAIETVVARGRMDFASLLAELVQDESQRRSILITAGIRPVSDTST